MDVNSFYYERSVDAFDSKMNYIECFLMTRRGSHILICKKIESYNGRIHGIHGILIVGKMKR